jgi:hypothetical protein
MSEKGPACAVCHRPLRDPVSVELGVGPVCRGKKPRINSSGYWVTVPIWLNLPDKTRFLGLSDGVGVWYVRISGVVAFVEDRKYLGLVCDCNKFPPGTFECEHIVRVKAAVIHFVAKYGGQHA